MAQSFETLKPTPSDKPPPKKPRLLILPKQFHQWEARMEIYEPVGAIPIQTTTVPPNTERSTRVSISMTRA